MKKLTVLISALIFFSFALTAQMNVSVSVTDDIYEFLDVAHKKGLCSALNSYKPYTRAQILESLQEIYENSDKMSDREIEMVEEYLALYEPSTKNDKRNALEAHLANTNEDFPITFNYKSEFEFVYSGGLYSDSDYNSWGMDNMYKLNFDGDLGKGLSYRLKGVLDFSYMPLMEIGEYFIGYPWYDDEVVHFLDGDLKKLNPEDETEIPTIQYDVLKKARNIRRYLNNSYLPYSYKKPWSGQFYFAKNMNAAGLEGWRIKSHGVVNSILQKI